MSSKGYIDTKTAVSMAIYEKFSDLAAMSFIFFIAAKLHYKFDTLIILTLFFSVFILICYASLHTIYIFENAIVRRLRRTKVINKMIEFAEIIYLFKNSPDVDKRCLAKTNIITILLWIVHIIQITLFFYLLNLYIPILTISTYMLCAIFVGLLPITIAGLGTRDLTIVYLFKDILTYNEAISIGILSTLRYIIPTIIGLPFFMHLMFSEKDRLNKKQ